MKLLQELNGMNQQRKYRVTFSMNAVVYNTPNCFEIPDDADDRVEFKGEECKELQDAVKGILAADWFPPRMAEHGNIKVLDVEIEEVNFNVGGFINDAAEKADDEFGGGFDGDEDEDRDPEDEDGHDVSTYGDAMQFRGGDMYMDYELTVVITTDGPVDHGGQGEVVPEGKSALLHWMCDDVIAGCIWGQYADDGGGPRDFHIEEIQ